VTPMHEIIMEFAAASKGAARLRGSHLVVERTGWGGRMAINLDHVVAAWLGESGEALTLWLVTGEAVELIIEEDAEYVSFEFKPLVVRQW